MQNAIADTVGPVEPFLFAEKLRPGHVILTLGTEKFSSRITKVTKSTYSHVSLVVSGTEWFEADDDGVGFSTLLGMGGYWQGPAIRQRVIRLRGCSRAAVYAHPALAEFAPEEIESAIRDVVKPWEGEDYSDYRRLFNPLAVSGKPAWWVRLALKYYQWRDRRRPSGMFCSEVVGRVFEGLDRIDKFSGTALFSVPRRADLIHPGHFEASRLQPVASAVGYTRPLGDGIRIEWQPINLDRRFPTQMARQRREFAEILAGIDADHAKTHARLLEDSQLDGARREHEIRDLLATARNLHASRTAQLLEQLLKDVEANGIGLREYFASHDPQLSQFFELSARSLEFGLRFQSLQCDLLEETTPTTDTALGELQAVVAAARARLAEKSEHQKREFERIQTDLRL